MTKYVCDKCDLVMERDWEPTSCICGNNGVFKQSNNKKKKETKESEENEETENAVQDS